MPIPLAPDDPHREAYERGRREALEGFSKAMENACTEVNIPGRLKDTIMKMVRLAIRVELSAQQFYREKKENAG